jgi:hydroxyacyl-ACP dehydratase HTD2-like protein with hotdog domain
MDFDSELRSLERSERSRAHGYREKAESSRDDLSDLPRMWPQGAPQAERQRIRDEISKHEMMAAVCERRADFAAEGFMYLGDDEHSDQEFMGRHQHMIAEAHDRGRAKVSSS